MMSSQHNMSDTLVLSQGTTPLKLVPSQTAFHFKFESGNRTKASYVHNNLNDARAIHLWL